nr:hypothetical protein L204_06430 [Cryptococcus depauperatus CBS 7855]
MVGQGEALDEPSRDQFPAWSVEDSPAVTQEERQKRKETVLFESLSTIGHALMPISEYHLYAKRLMKDGVPSAGYFLLYAGYHSSQQSYTFTDDNRSSMAPFGADSRAQCPCHIVIGWRNLYKERRTGRGHTKYDWFTGIDGYERDLGDAEMAMTLKA